MSSSRLDVAYTMSRRNRYTQCSNQDHCSTLTRLYEIFKGITNYVIEYCRFPTLLEGYNDANSING